jgi:primosomal replication protein N
VVEFRLEHQSEQQEAGGKREVKADIPAVAFQAQAQLLTQTRMNAEVKVEGFLSAKSKRSKKLVLHVTNIEFLEGH